MTQKKQGFIFISLYQSHPSYHGASDITSNFFKKWKNKNKKIIQISNNIIKNKKIINVKKKNGFFGTLINIIIITLITRKELFKYKKKYIVIEGASWIGYIYLLIKLIKLLIKDIKIIYHAHNLEYEVRKLKNYKLISFLSFYLEKLTYKNTTGTSVSNQDKKFIKKNYFKNTILFENFINPEKPKKISNLNLKKKNYVLFCGSYSYWPNKFAIDKIIKEKKIISKKFKKIKFVFTGKDYPLNNDKDILNLGIVSKKHLVWLYKNCLFFYAPLPKAPGTKIKIIEAIYYGATVICSKNAIRNISRLKDINFLFIVGRKKISNIINFIKSKKFTNLRKKNAEFKKYYNCSTKIKKFNDELFKKKFFE